MQDKVIQVIGDDRSVSIDGERFVCIPASMGVPRGLTWDPSVKAWPGYQENDDGTGKGFKDYAHMAPYVALWEAAKKDDDADKAAQKAHEEAKARRQREMLDAENAAHEADVARIAREIEARRPYDDALFALASSDHEVIKAMEAKLTAEGLLDAKLVADRKAWRAKAKASKPK